MFYKIWRDSGVQWSTSFQVAFTHISLQFESRFGHFEGKIGETGQIMEVTTWYKSNNIPRLLWQVLGLGTYFRSFQTV